MHDFRRFVYLLKKKYPQYRVCVRRLPISQKLFGDCDKLSDGSFRIRISRELDEHLAIQTLIHEMAHILAWDKPGDDHGAAWGRAYSQVYRVYVKDFLGV